MTINTAVRIARLQVRVFRHPIERPVITSFGVMKDRPCVLVCVEDDQGVRGWGEVWCNFPSVGAEHRARLVNSVLWPMLEGRSFASPREAFAQMSAATAVLAIQSGEPGPLAQAVAGVDLALWDLVARRAGLPLWRALREALGLSVDGTTNNDPSEGDRRTDPTAATARHSAANGRIPVYASGINPDSAADPDGPRQLVARRRAEGYTAFKLKIGFEPERDLRSLRGMQEAAGPGADLMVDANQAWDLTTALARMPLFADFGLRWIEEPLRADVPWAHWQILRARSPAPLAAGENVAGDAAFDALLAARAVAVVQPDVAKWGGHSGNLPIVQRVLAAGLRHCPHYLGGGIGLRHAGHLLAATGGTGRLEIDANDNPLRTLLCGSIAQVSAGEVQLEDAPGIGAEPDLDAIREIETLTL